MGLIYLPWLAGMHWCELCQQFEGDDRPAVTIEECEDERWWRRGT